MNSLYGKAPFTMTYREAGGENRNYEVNQIDKENRWSFSNTFTVTLKVCGNSLEQGYVKNASVDYTHTWKSSEVRQRQVCQPRGEQSGYSGNPPDGDRRRHIDMALNNERCSIEGQDEKRKALKQNCVPQVVYDSILEHEKTHAKQCMSEHTAKEFASRTPDSFRKFEQSAYCTGAKKLLNWADGVCKESDVKPLREVYLTYCQL